MSTYEQATEVFTAFLPTLVKLQDSGFSSFDENYWRSRWHEWVNPHSDDSKPEFERKRMLQQLWKEVWYYFHPIFSKRYHIPDRLKLKTHLVSCQQMANAFLAFTSGQKQPVDEPQNATLWYLRYHLWNETIQHGGLATESLWPAAWPLIQEALKEQYIKPVPIPVVSRPVDTSQLDLFKKQD